MTQEHVADVAVVGGGIIGLAFAHAYAREGRKVVLFERTDFAVGASVRNFGLIWPVGQRCGRVYDRAMRSRELWLEVIRRANLWHAPSGSMHLAYAPDEAAVLEEYLAHSDPDAGRKLLGPEEVLAKSHAVQKAGLLGALWSPTEINVDPRQAVRSIPALLRDQFKVDCHFGTNVSNISLPKVTTSAGDWHVSEAVVCSGADFETLYPEIFKTSGLTRCKLQMLRTRPQSDGWHLGPSLCAGLTLGHYDCFKDCLSLKPLQERFRREMPFYVEHGIHVLLSETALGELTVGDSHQYGLTLEPFDRKDIDDAVWEYLNTFARFPRSEIGERWNGTYSKVPGRTEYVAEPAAGVRVVTGLSGAGMTMSFGLAEEIVQGRYAAA